MLKESSFSVPKSLMHVDGNARTFTDHSLPRICSVTKSILVLETSKILNKN